jgi:hypothetical protein
MKPSYGWLHFDLWSLWRVSQRKLWVQRETLIYFSLRTATLRNASKVELRSPMSKFYAFPPVRGPSLKQVLMHGN